MKTYEQFVNETFNTDDELVKSLSSICSNFKKTYNLDLPDLTPEDVQNVIKLKTTNDKLLFNNLIKSNVSFYLNDLNKIKDTKYFAHVNNELKNGFKNLLVLLLDQNGIRVSMSGIKYNLEDLKDIMTSDNNKKPSESSSTSAKNPKNIIKFNVQGGVTGDANFMNDSIYGWICHELGHEMYNRRGVKYDKLIDIDKFEKILDKNKYPRKDFLSYPDGNDERVSCFYQFSYLKDKYQTADQIVKIEKESYPGTWNNTKPLYFTSWFEYFQNK